MLHAAELERWNENEVELAEPVGNRCVFFEPLERLRVKVEHRLLVALHFLRIRLAMEHAVPASIALGSLHLKFTGGKCEEIGRNRLSLGIASAGAFAGNLVKRFGAV